MDDLLAIFGLGRAITLTVAMGVAAAAFFTTPIDAESPSPASRPAETRSLLPPEATGEQIYRAACATCHGQDGSGPGPAIVGFALPLANGHDLPDFTDCSTNTVEPLGDWIAVAARGGPVRALDRHMPAFGEALTASQLERVVKHLWSFCADAAWPRGDLNLPRAFFTEKAFPENEAVWTAGVTTAGPVVATTEFVYEHRIGARGQYELRVPFSLQLRDTRVRTGRVGDLEVAVRRTLHASLDRGSIFAAGGAVTLPTGDEAAGLGDGVAVVEPFAMWGQLLGPALSLQVHGGLEIPTNRDRRRTEGFVRTAVAYTVAQDGGFGRAWTPMTELLVALPADGPSEWDLVPQAQLSLSKLQHVLLNVGIRVPLNERHGRKPELLTYVLWDWFDGGLFRFWR